MPSSFQLSGASINLHTSHASKYLCNLISTFSWSFSSTVGELMWLFSVIDDKVPSLVAKHRSPSYNIIGLWSDSNAVSSIRFTCLSICGKTKWFETHSPFSMLSRWHLPSIEYLTNAYETQILSSNAMNVFPLEQSHRAPLQVFGRFGISTVSVLVCNANYVLKIKSWRWIQRRSDRKQLLPGNKRSLDYGRQCTAVSCRHCHRKYSWCRTYDENW